MAVQFRGDRFSEEVEEVAMLLFAGRDRGPHAFVIPLPRLTARALRDAAIDHAVPHRLEPTDRCQEPRPEDRAVQFGAVGDVELAIGILVDSQSVFGDMNRSFRQFNVLDDVEVARRGQS